MPTYTSVFNLKLPSVGSDANEWGGYLNSNFEDIEDLLVGAGSDIIAPNLGTVGGNNWRINGTAVTTTGAELNALSGLTSTSTELNLLHYDHNNPDDDHVFNDNDGFLVFDTGSGNKWAGMVPLYNYINAKGITTVGALEGGSITSDFGNIDIGDSTITTTGAVTFGSLTDSAETPITITGFADEDEMTSDSAELVPTQQSVKAYVDNTVAETGKVLQVVSAVTSSNATYTDTDLEPTDLFVDITPKSTTSKFLVTVNINISGNDNNYIGLGIQRKIDDQVASDIGNPTTGTGNRRNALATMSGEGGYHPYTPSNVCYQHFDTASGFTGDDTSIRYTATVSNRSGYTAYLNKGHSTVDDQYVIFTVSTITVTEIAG